MSYFGFCQVKVLDGYRMTPCFLLRLELCNKLNIFYIIEQPESSLLFRYKPFWRLLKKHSAHRVKCSLGAFNAQRPHGKAGPMTTVLTCQCSFLFRSSWSCLCLDSLKVVFWGTAPFLKQLSRQVTSKQRRQQQLKRNMSGQASSPDCSAEPIHAGGNFVESAASSNWILHGSIAMVLVRLDVSDIPVFFNKKYWMIIGGTCWVLELSRESHNWVIASVSIVGLLGWRGCMYAWVVY